MGQSRFEVHFVRSPLTLILTCLAILMIPVTWIAAWLVSTAVHELAHLLMALLLSVNVHGMTIDAGGAVIETEPMEPLQEFLCASAGPLAGCQLMSVGRLFPLIALFAFCQTLWNLLPFGDHDGARMLRALWTMIRKIPCKVLQERVQ